MRVLRVKRAIVSVSDKTGVVELAKGLRGMGIEILSTGGTLALLKKNRVQALSISSYTSFPEILEGRVKTLHPKIHGGLLYVRGKKSQAQEARKHGILPIDMVVVNLYPFEERTRGKKIPLSDALEEIDIGGPTMLRAAAKNFMSVACLSDPADYAKVLAEMKGNMGKISKETLQGLAGKVFRLTSRYDSVISEFLSAGNHKEVLPDSFSFHFRKVSDLRYGENPHQKAALYEEAGKEPPLYYRKLHGKELSYNNLADLESAWEGANEFEEPAACVIKHNTPSGMAVAKTLREAVANAIDCDVEAGFGGIIGLNRPCDGQTAQTILERLSFLEVIAAPSFDRRALALLTARKNLRLVEVAVMRPAPLAFKFSKLGLLVQDADPSLRGKMKEFEGQVKCVTAAEATPSSRGSDAVPARLVGTSVPTRRAGGRAKRGPLTRAEPSRDDLEELFFAWRAVKIVKSNAIVISRGRRTVGIGAGQMSRVEAVRIACAKAQNKAKEAYLASDGFFPMPDSIDVAASHGIRAIVQPGGSVRDQEVIDAANRHGIVMLVTGKRHFRH